MTEEQRASIAQFWHNLAQQSLRGDTRKVVIERAEEDVTDLLAEVEQLKAENAAMREVVQSVAASEPETSTDHGLTTECYYCAAHAHVNDDGVLVIDHNDDCIWLKARAILAQP